MKNLLLLIIIGYSFTSNGQIYEMDNVNGQTISTCGGVFTDDGGPNGNYGNGNDYTVTFCSATGGKIAFDFTQFNLQNGADILRIYDGPSIASQQLYSSPSSNEANPGYILSTGNCITFTWHSNNFLRDPGWQAVISCPAFCNDGIMNGIETGVDCGGDCPPCHCYDGIQNFNEEFIDCGGSCAPCPDPCEVEINVDYGPTGSLSCDGGDIILTASGNATQTSVFSNDFNTGNAGTGWTSNITADFENPCDPSYDGGTYMWMGNSAQHPRIIQTDVVNVSCGGQICFYLDFATQSDLSPCEGIDLAHEGVYLEYSIDNGNSWVVIEYFGPGGVGNSTSGGGSNAQMTSWNQYCFDIPSGAWSSNTIFHWAQTGSSGLNNDHWGIDDVEILANQCYNYVYDWTHIAGGDNNPIDSETVNNSETYVVWYTNNVNDWCTDTIEVTVPLPPVVDAGTNISGCEGETVNLGGNPVATGGDGNYTYNWFPSVNLNNSSLSNPEVELTYSSLSTFNTTIYTLTVTDGNNCSSSDDIAVIVDPTPDVDPVSDIELCHGETFPMMTFSGSEPSTNYVWYVDNTTIGIGNIGVDTISPFQAVNNTTQPIIVSCTVIPDIPGGCTGDPITFSITVNPVPTVNQIADIELCASTMSNAINFNGNLTGTTYEWTNNNNSIGLSSFGENQINSFTALNFSDNDQVSIINVIPVFNGCVGSSESFEITVHPTPTVDAVIDQVLCSGESTDDVVFTGSVANTTFNWTNSETSIGLLGSGTGNINSFTSLNPSTDVVNALIEVLPAANGCQGDITSFNIEVTPSPTINPLSDVIYCTDEITSLISFSGNNPNTNYSWTNSDASIGLAASGSGDISPFTIINGTNSDVISTINIAPSFNGCNAPVETFTITVHPTPTVDAVLDQVLCSGESTDDVVFTGSVANTSFNWTNSETSIGLSGSGTGDINSFVSLNPSTAVVNALIEVLPEANGCQGDLTSFNIEVTPSPTINTLSDEIYCEDETTSLISFSGNNPNTNYSWTNSETSIGLAASGSGDITPFTISNPTTSDIVSTLVVSSSFNGCDALDEIMTITVHPTPTVDAVIDQVLCSGESTDDVVFTGSVANTTFNWTNSETSIGLSGSGTGDINSFVSLNPSTAVVNALIEVLPTANGCQGDLTSFNIEVNPIPTVDPMIDGDYCTGEITSQVTFTGSVPSTNFSWTNSDASIGLAASGSGNIMDFTTTNLTSGDLNAIISVTPSLNGCEGPTDDFTFTIHPVPTVTAISDQELCADETTQAVSFSGSIASTTFTWINSNTDIGLVGFGGGDINSFNAQNSTSIPSQGVIEVTPSANGCFGSPEDFTITVNPLPIASINGSITLCENDTNPVLLIEGENGVAPYTIGYTLNNGPTQYLTTVGSSASITVPTNVSGTFTYTIVSIEDNSTTHCSNTQNETAIVVVNPLPVINAGVDITVCEFDQVILTASGAGAQGSYTWMPLVTNGLPFEPSVGTQTYSVVGTDINGCQNTDDLDITVIPTPIVNFSASELSACEELTTTFLNSSIGNLDNCVWTISNGDTHQGCADWSSTITDIGCFDVTLEISTPEGCTNSATYEDYICIYENPVAAFTPTPETLYVYAWESTMVNESIGASSYIWDFGDFSQNSTATNPTHEFPNNEAGTYEIQLIAISDQNCVDTAYQTVIVIDELLFFVPNTFTPDGDDHNQVFTPVFTTGYDPQNYEMLIFNRWGELIFETHDVNVGWNGTYGQNIELCQDGTYTWKIKVKNTAQNKIEEFVGSINLIR